MAPRTCENRNARCRSSLPSATSPEFPLRLRLAFGWAWKYSSDACASSTAGLHFLSPAGLFMTLILVIQLEERSWYRSTHWGLWSCPTGGIFLKALRPRRFHCQCNRTHYRNLSHLNSDGQEIETYHQEFSVVQPWGLAHRRFVTLIKVSLWAPSFHFQGHLPLSPAGLLLSEPQCCVTRP